MIFDRQMEHAPGDAKLLSRPPFACDPGDGALAVRYSERLNYQGYEMAGRRMDRKADEMFAAIAGVLENPEVRIDLDFRPGQIQWINNAATGPRRTAYKDFPDDPARRRLLIRMWLRDRGRVGYLG